MQMTKDTPATQLLVPVRGLVDGWIALSYVRQRGAAILDVILAIAIFLIITAGVIAFFLSGSTAANENDVLNEVGAIQTVVQSLYAGQPNYDGLSSATIAGSNQLSTKWIASTTTLASAYGPVVVTSVAPYDSYDIQFDDVSQAACVSIATKDLGTSSEEVGVNTSSGYSGSMTPAEAQQYCAAGDDNTVSFLFFN
jgi:major structural subunit of bundle-forming pilus